jgi:hypothetical protein
MPIALLTQGVREGDILDIEIAIDEEMAEE